MARITKVELEQINLRIATENAALRAEVERLRTQLEAERAEMKRVKEHRDALGIHNAEQEKTIALLRQDMVNVTEVASAVNRMAAKPRVKTVAARELTPQEIAWREAAEKARALAVASGRSVAVG